MRDHFIEEPFGHQFAPFTALGTVASVTKRLRVGSLVFSNDYRHPLLLAKEAATLDVLSGGRLELGLGTGFESREYEQTGLSLDSTSVRAERLGEGVQILKKAFAGEPFTFTGTYYSVTEFKSFPPSLQRPHPLSSSAAAADNSSRSLPKRPISSGSRCHPRPTACTPTLRAYASPRP